MTVFKKYIKAMDYVNRITGWIVAIMMAVMVVLISWQVYARFLGGESLTWSEEISRFIMVWSVMLGTALCLRRSQLIAVEFVPEIVGDKWRKVIKLITHILNSVFFFIITYYGWILAINLISQEAAASGLSMFWAYASLPVSGLLMFLNTIVVVIELFGDEAQPGPDDEIHIGVQDVI